MSKRTYTLNPRPARLGGGFKVVLLADGREVGGGVFPAGHKGESDAVELGESHCNGHAPDFGDDYERLPLSCGADLEEALGADLVAKLADLASLDTSNPDNPHLLTLHQHKARLTDEVIADLTRRLPSRVTVGKVAS